MKTRKEHSINCLEAHGGVGKDEGFTCTDNCLNNLQHTPKAAHTPGPWKVSDTWRSDGLAGETWHVKIESGHELIVPANALGATEEKAQANARLIAAAPELLELLKEIHNFFETGPRRLSADALRDDAETFGRAIERLIAKAEGSQTHGGK